MLPVRVSHQRSRYPLRSSCGPRGAGYGRPCTRREPTAVSMGQPGTNVGALCKELGITRQTLYPHVSPTGELRDDGRKILGIQ